MILSALFSVFWGEKKEEKPLTCESKPYNRDSYACPSKITDDVINRIQEVLDLFMENLQSLPKRDHISNLGLGKRARRERFRYYGDQFVLHKFVTRNLSGETVECAPQRGSEMRVASTSLPFRTEGKVPLLYFKTGGEKCGVQQGAFTRVVEISSLSYDYDTKSLAVEGINPTARYVFSSLKDM